MAAKIIPFETFVDERGELSAIDGLPFPAVRAFWIEKVPPGQRRGGHAHKECHQVLVAVRGQFEVAVMGAECSGYRLEAECGVALWVPPGDYVLLSDWSEDAVCLVLASHPYDPADTFQ